MEIFEIWELCVCVGDTRKIEKKSEKEGCTLVGAGLTLDSTPLQSNRLAQVWAFSPNPHNSEDWTSKGIRLCSLFRSNIPYSNKQHLMVFLSYQFLKNVFIDFEPFRVGNGNVKNQMANQREAGLLLLVAFFPCACPFGPYIGPYTPSILNFIMCI